MTFQPAGYPPSPLPPNRGGGPGVVRTLLSVLWALLPLVTLGLGTPAIFLYAAARLRSGWLAATLYAIFVLAMFVVVGLSSDPPTRTAEGFVGLTAAVLMLFGTAHAFIIRPSVFFGTSGSAFGLAVADAKRRRELRQQARALVADDPEIARDLRVGRPDLKRSYDDGGLVDVNHVPHTALAQLPAMTPELVERVVVARAAAGTFGSVEELSAAADLPSHLTTELAEYAIFLR